MGINPFRRHDDTIHVVIITVSCCMQGVVQFEEQTHRIVEQAISETGVPTQVKIVPATRAFFAGGTLKRVMFQLMADVNQGTLKVPVVLIDGKAVSYGVPNIEDIKSALLQAAATKQIKKEDTSEPEPKSSHVA